MIVTNFIRWLLFAARNYISILSIYVMQTWLRHFFPINLFNITVDQGHF